MANYLSDKTGAEIDASLDKADISYGTDNTGITSNGDVNVDSSGSLTRDTNHTGHMEGGHNNVAFNDTKSNPIYTRGSGNNPNESDLNNMFGVGYSAGTASFLSQFSTTGWGQYVAADGDARLFLDASTGTYYGSGAVLSTLEAGLVTGDDTVVLSPDGFGGMTLSRSTTGTVTQVTFNNPNGAVGTIKTTGSATSYNVSSDERLKENFEPITDAFDLIKAIVETKALQYFTFKSDPSTKVPGFVAQRLIACGAGGMVAEGEGSLDLNVEIGTVYQEAVIERTELTEEVTDSSGNLKTVGTGEFTEKVITPEKRVTPCGVDQSKAVPHLMQLCYDQQMQINALLARLDAANI